jgi:hypothetical protein
MEREFTFDPGADSPTDETHVTVGNLTRFAAQKQATRGQGDKETRRQGDKPKE